MKLKLGLLADDKAVKLTVELPAAVYRDLQSYAELLRQATGASAQIEPAKLIVPMIERFMATDRAFTKMRRSRDPHRSEASPERSG